MAHWSMHRRQSWSRVADRSHARGLPLTPRLIEAVRDYRPGNRADAYAVADAVYLATAAGAELPGGVLARLARLRSARGPEAVTDALLDLAAYAHDVLSAAEAYCAAGDARRAATPAAQEAPRV